MVGWVSGYKVFFFFSGSPYIGHTGVLLFVLSKHRIFFVLSKVVGQLLPLLETHLSRYEDLALAFANTLFTKVFFYECMGVGVIWHHRVSRLGHHLPNMYGVGVALASVMVSFVGWLVGYFIACNPNVWPYFLNCYSVGGPLYLVDNG